MSFIRDRWAVDQLLKWSVFGYILATGFPSWIRLSLLLSVSCLLIRTVLLEKDGTLQPIVLTSHTLMPVSLYLGAILVSWSAASITPPFTVFDQIPSSLVVFLAVVRLAKQRDFAYRMAGVLTVWATLLACDALAQFHIGHSLLSNQTLVSGRVSGPFTSANDLTLLPLLLPFVFWRLKSSSRITYLTWLTIPLVTTAVLLSGSRNAWGGLMVALLLIGVLTHQKRGVLIAASLVVALLAISYVGDIGSIQQRTQAFTQVGADNRLGYWTVAWHLFVDAPFLGQGPGTFSQLYKEYHQSLNIPYGTDPRTPPHPHNIPLELLAEQGLLGASAFVFLLFIAIRQLIQRARQPGRQQEVEATAASACIFFWCGLFDLSLWREWVSLYFWLLYGLAYAPSITNSSRR